MIAPTWYVDLSSALFVVGGTCMWITSILLIRQALTSNRWQIFWAWPPVIALAVGLPVFFSTTHFLLYSIGRDGHLPDWIDRRTWFYETLPIIAGVGMIILFVLGITGNLKGRNHV
jgi:hypothetical protein